jgi:hypothetical protein
MRVPARALVPLLLTVVAVLAAAAPSRASSGQLAMFEADPQLYAQPQATLATLRSLGVGVVRVAVHWGGTPNASPIVPGVRPPGFAPARPSSPGYNWGPLDAIVRQATADGIAVDLTLSAPAPAWAVGPGAPNGTNPPEWRPRPAAYGQFVHAVAARYDGRFSPAPGAPALPAVHMWEIWNEPNFGQELAPQAIDGSRLRTAAGLYRALVDAAWPALVHTPGHARDTIILGNLDARGQSGRPTARTPQGYPGYFGDTKPLVFVRDLYCVDSRFRPLRGRPAAAEGCPTTAAATRRFAAAHPALFAASGFGDHPYPYNGPPTVADSRDPDFAEFNELPRLARTLDRALGVYHSRHRFAVYNNEYGYITNPPNHRQPFVSPATAARYLNWAEYLSWRNPRIASTMQYLLVDPPLSASGFASGLEFAGGARKPTYDAYRLPLYLPASTVRRGHPTVVWGCARPAHTYGNERVLVQFRAHHHGPWRQVAAVAIHNARGYFETRLSLSTSGDVRLVWSYPTGPTVYSRTAPLTIS